MSSARACLFLSSQGFLWNSRGEDPAKEETAKVLKLSFNYDCYVESGNHLTG